jgi:SEC-C motif
MIDYAKMMTAELIDLLFKEEDRATEQHIKELIGRGEEAAAPLREILKNEDYWYEGRNGDHWMPVHAIVILGALRDEKAFPDLIEMAPHVYFSNHEGVMQVLPAALAEYGGKAVEPYVKFITEYRGAYWDNPDFSTSRCDFSEALTRIALRDELVRGRVTDFICESFADPEEDDSLFLSLSAAHPVALDKERGLRALRMAFSRGAIDEAITGKFKELVRSLEDPNSHLYRDIEYGLFEFYDPEVLDERQREKGEREKEEENLYWGSEETKAPSGYEVTAEGVIHNLQKIGRNDPCPCGSGRKYKKCCGIDR